MIKCISLSVIFLTVLFALCASAGDNPRSVIAVKVTTPPHIDGILDDEVWKLALPATDFIQRDPSEGQPGSERSEIRVLYDEEALYFGCMFYDKEPEKIVSRLSRRDDEIEADEASIRIDSYHDHQTGYEFTFNAAGVKIDMLQFDDANREDDSWDPVWDVQTKIVTNGWCAEIKIPFRILHYRTLESDTAENIWGINFLRYISRKQESERWAFTPKSQSGFISRYGHLRGLRNLPTPRQFEVLPFITGKQSYYPASAYRDRREQFSGNGGLDLKYGLSSNFLVDATINPDFGQVEADPAVLNLSTYETFYPEKRPFFIEGTQFIRFSTFGNTFGPGMFYSRRIGRAISEGEVNVPVGGKIIDLPSAATILGAAKLSGKTNTGLSVGALEAFTQEENATVQDSLGRTTQQTVEPFAHYNVIRLKQDFSGNSNIGMIVTSVEKNSRLPAFTNGFDWSIKLDSNSYSLDGFLAISHTYSSSDDRKAGSAGKLAFAKTAGEHWLWTISSDYTSKQYNINDVGFFFSPNDAGIVGTITYKQDIPAEVVRNYNAAAVLHIRNNFDGVNLFRAVDLSGYWLFTNYWNLSLAVNSDFGLYDEFETRGNGLYAKPQSYSISATINTDQRHDIVGVLNQQYLWDNKQKKGYAAEIGINMRPVSWMQWLIDGQYQRILHQEAWTANEGAVSIFGDRTTEQYNFTVRSTLTFTRDLTLQVYGQEFLAKGHYDDLRQLVGTSQFIPNVYSLSPDFNRQSLNTNVVLRWEYQPGSILYVVWSQSRSGQDGNYFTNVSDNLDETFRTPPSNILLLKLSYLLGL